MGAVAPPNPLLAGEAPEGAEAPNALDPNADGLFAPNADAPNPDGAADEG